jgi:PAS domain S-box-containing protein
VAIQVVPSTAVGHGRPILYERYQGDERFRRLVEGITDYALFILNTDGRVATWNAGGERIKGYTADEIIGRHFSCFYPPEEIRAGNPERALATALDQGRYEEEGWRLRKDGTRFWANVIITPLYDDAGKVTGFSKITRDFSKRKEVEEQLRASEEAQRKAVKAAEAANRAKSTFLANMSHEIRTPMNAVIGMTELLLGTELSTLQREYLAIVKDSAESLLALINDILDFSKVEAGKLELECTPFNVREVLGDTMKGLAVRANGKDLEVACHIHADVPESVEGDSLRLRQVVSNLVGNAIKFTNRGEVVLDVTQESDSADQTCLQFVVRDTGIGIPAEKQRAIFDAFSQVDASTTRRFGGTGLGLAISSRLVALMGGRLWVVSEVGRGSRFHFTALFRKTQQGPASMPVSETLVGLRVLVVDDNATNQVILREMLASWEMEPTTVSGAGSALYELRRAHEAGRPHQIVLTDLHMPDVDGFQLTERIKQSSDLGSPVILMLTSGDGPGDIDRCRQVGASAHLMKPVKQSDLLDAITQSLGTLRQSGPSAQKGAQETDPMRPLRILLAEDSPPNQRLAVGVLTKWGHQITVVNNGREALATLEKNSDQFDLVLMDVQMPELDGFQATSLIREREARSGTHLPIIAMTAHAMKGDREECLAAGMDGYVAKPIRRRELQQVIDEVLGQKAAGAPEQPKGPAPRPILDAINWEHAEQTTEGDPELLRQILSAVIETSPHLLIQMEEALRLGDSRELRRAAHTLKGSLEILGSTRTSELAERLEERAKSGQSEGTRELFESLAADTNVLIAELRSREELLARSKQEPTSETAGSIACAEYSRHSHAGAAGADESGTR